MLRKADRSKPERKVPISCSWTQTLETKHSKSVTEPIISTVRWASNTIDSPVKFCNMFLDAVVLARRWWFDFLKLWKGGNGHGKVKKCLATRSLSRLVQWLFRSPATLLYVQAKTAVLSFWKSDFLKEKGSSRDLYRQTVHSLLVYGGKKCICPRNFGL